MESIFSKKDLKNKCFKSEQEALEFLYELNKKYYGEYSYYTSQRKRLEKSSHCFDNDTYFLGSTIQEINSLPCNNIYKIRLDETIRKLKLNIFTEDTANKWLLKLIYDYKHQE